uniref:UDP-glucuronosyltransferase n=1 Tax=Lygus hesperus TaxID=30085 RepID=A0A146LHB3_LYGHE
MLVSWSVLLSVAVLCDAASILVVIPFRGYSHTVGPLKIANALSGKGHNVTVASFFPPKSDGSGKVTHLSLKHDSIDSSNFFSIPDKGLSTVEIVFDLHNERNVYTPVIENEAFKALQNGKFDLVILEYFVSDVFFGLVHKIGAPFILIHTTVPYPWQNELLAEPQCESYVAHSLNIGVGTKMNFYKRFVNFVGLNSILAVYQFVFAKEDQFTAEEHFGPLPNLRHIGREASMFFVNTHHSMSVPKPMSPATVEIGGIHIDPPKPLNQDLKTLLDESRGAIFFSFGSVMKGSTLPKDKKDAIMKVFAELDEVVLWKWEDAFADKPANVHTSKWFAQRDVLAHPKMSLYIGHCGALGLQEAVHEAVPTICLPFFADQYVNAEFLVESGMGLYLDFQKMNEEDFRETVRQVLQDPSFKKNALRISKAFLDRPMSPMDTAIYWTEYVLRHEGAPHLRSPARYLSWVEYHNVDVIAALLLIVSSVFYFSLKIAKSFIKCLLSARKSKEKVS